MPTQNYVITLAFLTIVMLGMLIHQRMLMKEQLSQLESNFNYERQSSLFTLSLLTDQLTEERNRVTSLTNLVTSKDPMSYQMLQAMSPNSSMTSVSEPYVETGTDDGEFLQYAEQAGLPLDDDYSTDVRLAFGE